MKAESLIVMTLIVLFSGCNQHKTEETTSTDRIGNYLYVDSEDCIHTRRRCSALHSQFKALYRIDFVDTLYLRNDDFIWYCSHCVSERNYQKINEIISRNTQRNEWEGVR